MGHGALNPSRAFADATKLFFKNPANPFAHTTYGKSVAAAMELFERSTRRYHRPAWGIDSTMVGGERVPIHVRVTVKDDRMTVDLSKVSLQVQGFYNSGVTAGRSCCQVAFKCLTSALELPINDGAFRALDIVLPPGRVVSAVKPAAMRMWMCYPMTIVDTIFKALAPALPNQVIAGHHADLVVGRINGRRPKDNSFYIYLGGLIGGGWGAKHDSDGQSATIALNDGDTHNGPSEQVEAKFPLLVERYCLRPDSGGAGRFRGGLGTEQVVQARHPIRFSSQMDRVKCKPWGLNGGLSGFGNGVALHRFGKTEEQHFANGKALNQVLQAGDAYILRSGGGGGYTVNVGDADAIAELPGVQAVAPIQPGSAQVVYGPNNWNTSIYSNRYGRI